MAIAKIMRNRVWTSIALCCIPFAAATGQETTAKQTVELSLVSYPAQIEMENFHLKTGEASQIQVNTPNQYFSEFYTVPLLEQWTIGRLRNANISHEKFAPAAKCKSLDALQQLLILGHPAEPEKNEHRLTVINCASNHFKYGSFMFLNLTDSEISAKIDEEKVKIGPNEQALIKPDFEGDRGVVQAQIFTIKQDREKMMLDGRWPLHPKVRSLVIFYSRENGRILMHTIRDQLPEKDEDADTGNEAGRISKAG